MTSTRHCIRCGLAGPFRNDLALKCEDCDERTAENRREYHRAYHAARSRAIRRLIDQHEDEFRKFMAEETADLVVTRR